LQSGFVTTVFDIWLLYATGEEEFREVKYRAQLRDPRVIRQLEAQKHWCRTDQTPHKVFDEHKIRASRLFLSNWKAILSMLTAGHDLKLTTYCFEILSLLEESPRTLGQLEDLFPRVESGLIRVATFRLLHTGNATASLHQQQLNRNLLIEARE